MQISLFRSCWTDTPLIKAKPKIESESQMSKRIADDAHRIQIQQKDIEQEKIVKKLKKKHKRDESLLELHQKKLRKKKKVYFVNFIFVLISYYQWKFEIIIERKRGRYEYRKKKI